MADGEVAGSGRRRPFEPGVSLYAPELGEAICARVAAGESLSAICEDRAGPCRNTVRSWAKAHPEFGEALRAATETARLAERLRDRQTAPTLTPGIGRPSGYSRALAEAICDRLANGESLTSIGRDPPMPCYGTILRWVRQFPEFADLYVEARQMQADYLFDEARDVAQAATAGNVWVSRLRFDVIRWQAARLRPHKYCERLVVAGELRTAAAPEPMEIQVVKFGQGPNGEPVVIPPRCAEEERDWERAYGRPYDGPR